MSPLLLGIDVGTTATKLVVTDPQGHLLAKSYHEYPLVLPQPNFVEQDMELVYSTLIDGLTKLCSELGERSRDIVALSLSTQRATMVPLDKNGDPLANGITWMDSRSGEQCARLEKDIGNAFVHESTGVAISAIWTYSYILWLKQHRPELVEKTACFALVHAFLMKRLGCSDYVVDYSNACETMVFDPSSHTWNKTLLDYAGIPAEKLPQLVPSGSVIGTIDPKLAKMCGLSDRVLLVSGGGDQQCAALGASILEDGDVSIGMGTAANILASSDHIRFDPQHNLMTNMAANPGAYFLEGAMVACGPILNWVRDLAFKGESEPVFDVLNREAASSRPGANGLILLPHFQGAGCPFFNDQATGVIHGLTLSTTRGDLARAVMEGLAFDLRRCLNRIEACGITPKRLVLTGGAAKSPVWCQIQADVYGMPLYTSHIPDIAAVGAIMLAGVASGVYADMAAAVGSLEHTGECYLPNRENTELYRELLAQSDRLYDAVYRS